MRQNWFIIDRWGRRSANCRVDSYWSRFHHGALDIDWPSFNQLVTLADRDAVVQAIRSFAAMLDVELVDVLDSPERWDGAVLVFQNGGALSISEPGVDLDERLLRPESADAICGLLAEDGAFFGFDEATSTLHVTTYSQGAPTLEWFDSELPGPSFARTFHSNGRATDEDPRIFALRELNMPESSPLLDRVAFVEAQLEPYELEVVTHDMRHLLVVGALRIVA